MEIITEDYVSFEIAKLLKEKGFVWACEHQYINCLSGHPFLTDIRDDAGCYYKNTEIGQDEYSAPTLQMTMKWLLKKYNIFICILFWGESDGYGYTIENVVEKKFMATSGNSSYKKPEKAADIAIRYCLENLI